MNFASRQECFQCSELKPAQPNEWVCPSCQFANLDFRAECRECQTKNPNGVNAGMREGDWNCDDCGHYNFARRINCHQCRADRVAISC